MLHFFTEKDRETIVKKRPGETKLGERSEVIKSLDSLDRHSAPFVLLGIREDIGIRANLGKGGADNCWDYALPSILNVQHNPFLSGEKLIMAGTLEFQDLMKEARFLDPGREQDLRKLRTMTGEIDKVVQSIIGQIVRSGKVPIVIGGGHNNAFGNIAGAAEGLGEAISVLNIDPHTDYRVPEGRHSGNGFRYADEAGHIHKYGVYGLHEGYNSDNILREFREKPHLTYCTFEDLLHRNTQERDQLFKNMLHWLGDHPTGLELDLDALTHFPVSALNPSGFDLNEARGMIRTASAVKKPVYFHICEGSPGRASSETDKEMLGKSIAYLVTDFIKSH